MTKAHPTPAKEKLRLLQENDHWRPWESLAEERQCIICERTFTGREVRIIQSRHGKPMVQCPTPDCSSSPREWIHAGNPLTDDVVWQDWQRILEDLSDDGSQPVARTKTTRAKAHR